MRLLYVSSGHPLLEADDCLTWEKLGIEWFSTGYYAICDKPGDLPYLPMRSREKYYPEFIQQIASLDEPQAITDKSRLWTNNVHSNIFTFTDHFLSRFDAIFFSHFAQNVHLNRHRLRKKLVVLRTYGMHSQEEEKKIKSLRRVIGKFKVVRTCENDSLNYPSVYGGADAFIRQSVVKDENEISGWNGNIDRTCTFTSYLSDTSSNLYMTRYNSFLRISDTIGKCDAFGIGKKFVKHEEKVDILQNYRANIVTGTPGAANTYSFIEAWIMGQPVVCFGRPMWSSLAYEPDQLIKHEVDGFICNDLNNCVFYCQKLLNNHNYARKIGERGRESALKIFGRDVIAQQWKDFYDSSL